MDNKLKYFLYVIEQNGDMFFSSGNKKADLVSISAVIKQQGYWAGVKHRYYFDEEFNLTDVEERFK